MFKKIFLISFFQICKLIVISQPSPCFQGNSDLNGRYAGVNDTRSLASADFNNDGYLDFVFTHSICSVQLMISDGTGNYTYQSLINLNPNYNNLLEIITDDFNSDGEYDIAVSNTSGGFYILFGNGNATFSQPIFHSSPGGQYSLLSSDFNNDSKPDIAILCNGSVHILLNNGTGSFLAFQTVTASNGSSQFIVLDFNNDGNIDIATANEMTNSIGILQGNGNGTFGSVVTYSLGSQPTSIASNDVNNDGFADLAVTNYNLGSVSLLLGNGNGGFSLGTTYSVDKTPYRIKFADFNGDGKKDLATLNQQTNDMSVLIANSNGSFASSVNYVAGMGMASFVIGDFNNDLKLDIIVSMAGGSYPVMGNVILLKGIGDGTFYTARAYLAGYSPLDITSNDFNGDGLIDIAVANDSTYSPYAKTITLLINTGAGIFGPPVVINLGSRPGAITSADYNGDGKIDIAVALMYGPVMVLLNNGSGGFTSQVAINTSTTLCRSLISDDFNGDGNIDLAFSNRFSHFVSVCLNNGNAVFSNNLGFSCQNASSVASGDFNGDGIVDIGCAGYNLVIGYGSGVGASYSLTNTVFSNITFSNDQQLAAGDLNSDGKSDVAIDGRIFLTNSSGGFYPPVTYVGIYTGALAYKKIIDINGDGKKDLICSGGLYTSVFLSDGTGILGIPRGFATGGGLGLTINDFNGDGFKDIATTSILYINSQGNVDVLLSDGQPMSLQIAGPVIACKGIPFTLTGNGCSTYSWSTGQTTSSVLVTQYSTITYSVIGTGTNGCKAVAKKTISVSSLSTAISNSYICVGETSTLSASGALTYTWSNFTGGSVNVVSPTVSTVYTVNAYDAGNCLLTGTLLVEAFPCVQAGIHESKDTPIISLFPNPTSEILNIHFNYFQSSVYNLILFNSFGLVLEKIKLIANQTSINVQKYPAGIYFYSISDGTDYCSTGKLVIE